MASFGSVNHGSKGSVPPVEGRPQACNGRLVIPKDAGAEKLWTAKRRHRHCHTVNGRPMHSSDGPSLPGIKASFRRDGGLEDGVGDIAASQ